MDTTKTTPNTAAYRARAALAAAAQGSLTEPWWAAVEATALPGDDVERPDYAHQARAAAMLKAAAGR